jgi:hypothetical protein
MPVQIWRNSRDVKPVGANYAPLGRIGKSPIDAAVMAERELFIGMERFQDRPKALTQLDALRKLSEALREFAVLLGKLEMTGKIIETRGRFDR